MSTVASPTYLAGEYLNRPPDGNRRLLDLAGMKAPRTSEGISFRPLLKGEKDYVRDTLYGAYCGGTKPGMRCVRKGAWKLIKYDTLNGEVRESQLFNLAENPNEFFPQHRDPSVVGLTGNQPTAGQTNLADDPRHAEKRAEIQSLLLTEMRRLNDPYRLWDQPQDGLRRPKPSAPKKKANPKKANRGQ